jgi:hypothetical protein
MEAQCCASREQLQIQIEEILRIRGPQDGLATADDVVHFALKQFVKPINDEALAVERLYQKVLESNAAQLERLLIWRRNLR